MPVHVTYPGVYVEELPSSEKTVTGISTSTTAFVDFFARGPMSDGNVAAPVQIFNYRDFQRTFGGLHGRSEASYAIMQFFNNGGETAWVVRSDDGTGLPAARRVEVRIPYLNDFAKDAAEAAQEAARMAHRAGNVVNGIISMTEAYDARRNLPKLAAGAAAEAASGDLPDAAPGAYKELAGTCSLIRSALQAAQNALDAAKKADADVTAAQQNLDNASIDFEQVDTRESVEELKAKVERSLASAKAVTDEAAALAKGVESYADGTAQQIDGVIASAVRGAGSLRAIAYSTGFSTASALAEVGALAAPYPPDAATTIDATLAAAQSAIDVATDVDGGVDALEARKLVRAARNALAAVKSAADDQKEAAIAQAVDATKAALTEAAKLPDAVLADAPSAIKERRKATDSLVEAIASADAAAAQARTALGEVGDPPDTDKTSAAIVAADAAVEALDRVVPFALALAPAVEGADSAGWPSIAIAADSAADLTLSAAEMTQVAADAAEAASKVLAERVLQYEAAHGAIAEQTRDAAAGASDAALEAKKAAGDAASEARKAAQRVTIEVDGTEVLEDGPENLEAAKKTIIDAAEAALNAAAAAGLASDRAMDAHMAAMAAGEAGAPPNLEIAAISPGVWGNELRAVVLNGTHYQFDIEVREYATRNGKATVVSSEIHRNLTLQDENAPNFAIKLVNHQSNMVRLSYKGPAVKGATPLGDGTAGGPVVTAMFQRLTGGRDGNPPGAQRLVQAMENALDHIAPSIFNILCLPITCTYPASEASVAITAALNYCERKRAFMIVDIPENVRTVADMQKWAKKYGNAANYSGAVYYPRLVMPDPLQSYRPRNVAPSGTMAGVYARTDSRRGIWKAPAGSEAVLQGVELASKMTDDQNGQLNPLGVNCLRAFPVYGNIAWGARTLSGADQLQSQWKYVNVRRLVYHIEESLYQALKWAVFEGNDENLWREIRQQVGGFLSGLFVDGAFAGTSPDKAYFVHCDSTTTTAADIANGIVNIVVGIAPIKPAEFIILQIEQIAGQD